jgi:hypothetical protein
MLGFTSNSYSQASITLPSNLPIPNSSFITDVWGYYDSATGKEYALITDNYLGLFIVDVTNPTVPSVVSQVNTAPGFDVKAWQHYAYTVNGGGSGSGGIVNISVPETPQVVGSFPSSHNIFISDNGYMYAEYPGLKIYNLNPDPTHPALVWSDQTGGGHDATVVGNQRGEGYAGAFGVYPFAPSGNIYVSDWDNGLFVFSFTDSTATGIDPPRSSAPDNYALHQNYPNPFNPSTTIKYEIPDQGFVSLSVYNLLGQKIRNLVGEVEPAGVHSVEWDGTDELGSPVPSGIYFYRMTTAGLSDIKRMILMK